MSTIPNSSAGQWADTQDQAALDHYIRSSGTTIFRPACTCVMAPPGAGVVNGIDGLRVAEASVMPAVVSGDTSVCMMIGGHAAQEILEVMSGRAGQRGVA